MQVLIVYYSRSGNTKKLAEEVAHGVAEGGGGGGGGGVKGVECVVKSADRVTKEDFLACDAVIAGSPVYFGSMAAPLKDMFDRLVVVRKDMGDKIGAAFATGGDATGGKETTMISIIQALLIYGMIIVGDPLDASGHYGVACMGSPDEKATVNARKMGKRVANLVKKVRG